MDTFSHLHALEERLANERARLSTSKSEAETRLRTLWVSQIEKEIEDEKRFLSLPEMSADELLKALQE